ncbi:hypothetical protein GQ457_16G021370 [Hibiscus cannabinus]
MASTSNNYLYESQLITKLPFFNGDNYPYWKNHMRLFVKPNDYLLLDVIEDGPSIPMKIEGDKLVANVKHEMTDEERRKLQVNDNALHMLFCAHGMDMYSNILSCTSAKEVWDTLDTTYEGTNNVKETNIGLLKLS